VRSSRFCKFQRPGLPGGRTLLALASVLVVGGQPLAYELDGELGLEAEFTDNVNLEADKDSDIGTEVYAAFAYRENSPRIQGVVDGRLGYREWLRDNADDEIRPNIHGNLLFWLRPERLSWSLDADWDQVRRDPVEPDSPSNLENRFVVWTGPDFRIPLSRSVFLAASARAGYADFADSESDDSAADAGGSSYSYGTAVRIVRDRGERDQVSANVTARAVRYTDDDVASADFNIVNTFIGYAAQAGRGNLSIDAGMSYLDRRGADDGSGLFLNAQAEQQLAPRSSGGLRLNFGYGNGSGTALDAPLSADRPDRSGGNASDDAFYRKSAEAYYELLGRRSRLVGTVFVDDRDYEDDLTDNELEYGANLTWSRRLTRLVDGRISAEARFSDFDDEQDSVTDEYRADLTLSRRLGRNVSADLSLRYRQGIGGGDASDYDETAATLALVYHFGRDRLHSTSYHLDRPTTSTSGARSDAETRPGTGGSPPREASGGSQTDL